MNRAHRGRPARYDTVPACGVCLDFGHIENLGPCPWCDPDREAEHVLQLAADLAALTAIEWGEAA